MPLGTILSLSPGNVVIDADPAPFPRGTSTQISAHVSCGQMAGWIKMPLSKKVSLGPGRIVLHEDPAPRPKRDTAPQFSVRVYCGQTVAHLS